MTSLPIHLQGRMTCCAYYHFNETILSPLGGEESVPEKWHEIIWNALTLTHPNPHTNQCELEVQRIVHLQNIVNQLQDAFIWYKESDKVIYPDCKYSSTDWCPYRTVNKLIKIRLKRGRHVGSNDVTLRKRQTQEKLGTLKEAIKNNWSI